MRALTLYTFLLLTTSLYGQVEGLILTQEQNNNWFATIEQLNLKDQIDALNKRFLADTNIFVSNNLDRVEVDKSDGRQAGFCKPLMVIGGIVISIENRTQKENIKYLTSLLTTKTVEKVEIIKEDQATALLGSRGICNGLIITISHKRTKKKLKKLEERMHRMVVKGVRWRH